MPITVLVTALPVAAKCTVDAVGETEPEGEAAAEAEGGAEGEPEGEAAAEAEPEGVSKPKGPKALLSAIVNVPAVFTLTSRDLTGLQLGHGVDGFAVEATRNSQVVGGTFLECESTGVERGPHIMQDRCSSVPRVRFAFTQIRAAAITL